MKAKTKAICAVIILAIAIIIAVAVASHFNSRRTDPGSNTESTGPEGGQTTDDTTTLDDDGDIEIIIPEGQEGEGF